MKEKNTERRNPSKLLPLPVTLLLHELNLAYIQIRMYLVLSTYFVGFEYMPHPTHLKHMNTILIPKYIQIKESIHQIY